MGGGGKKHNGGKELRRPISMFLPMDVGSREA